MISIVICSIDEAKLTRVARNYASLLRGEEFEIIGIRDAKSLCEGYSRGFSASKGGTLVFSHDDIEILSPDLAGALRRALQDHDMVGVAGTSAMMSARWLAAGQPHIHGLIVYPPGAVQNGSERNQGYLINVFGAATPIVGGIQGLDGVFIAARRELVERVGFDQQTFDGFHGYDADFSFSAYLGGFRLAVSAEIVIAHQSTGTFDAAWSKYSERFIAKHRARLFAGPAGPIRGFGAQQPTAQDVLRYCAPERIAQMTANIRSEAGAS
jgi:GT2 family glycosyltransferase